MKVTTLKHLLTTFRVGCTMPALPQYALACSFGDLLYPMDLINLTRECIKKTHNSKALHRYGPSYSESSKLHGVLSGVGRHLIGIKLVTRLPT